MIIKGASVAGPGLAAHLSNAETNERVEIVESRGTVARDLRGALCEMQALAAGTRSQKPLYHAAISPEPPHLLTPEQMTRAVNALEEELGLVGHARIVVIHEKKDRQHIHVVWSRIDLEKMRAVSDSHNYRRHEKVARELERRFGHDRVQGAHYEPKALNDQTEPVSGRTSPGGAHGYQGQGRQGRGNGATCWPKVIGGISSSLIAPAEPIAWRAGSAD